MSAGNAHRARLEGAHPCAQLRAIRLSNSLALRRDLSIHNLENGVAKGEAIQFRGGISACLGSSLTSSYQGARLSQ